MNDKIAIALVLGTKRQGRQSEKAWRWIAAEIEKRDDVEVIMVDPRDFILPDDGAPEDGSDPRYSDITSRVDAFFIVTPEYNNSYPSSLKRLLDSEFKNYARKPVMVAGVSNGAWGGTRACIALQPVMHTLGLVNISKKLYFPKIQEIFDDQNNMNAQFEEEYTRNLNTALDELLWFARALKVAKQQ